MIELIAQYGQAILDIASGVLDFLKKYHFHYGAMLCAATFAATYWVKFIYKISAKEKLTPNIIRGITLFSGVFMAFVAWPWDSPMPWYVAGILAGPGSIFFYDVLANTLGVKWPWFGTLLRGYRS